MPEKSCIKLLSLNVCGVISKLRCPDFVSFISEYDIIGLQETKTDETDQISIPGFETYIFSREKLSNYRSGGIAIIVRNTLMPYIKIDSNNKSNLIKFFTISKEIYGSKSQYEEDLKCGIVYIPPSSSRYSHADPFFEIQNEIFNFLSENKHCLLFGDWNSRCGNLTDYVKMDELISNLYDLQDIQNEESAISNNFARNNIPVDRNNIDTVVNAYGTNLIELCKNNDMFLWNGRLFSDYLNPKLTCKNSSTVDFFLSTSYVFENVVDFKVHDFCDLYSDVHSPIHAFLKTKLLPSVEHTEHNDLVEKEVKLWDKTKANNFNDNLDIFKVSEIEMKLDKLTDSLEISQTNIDEITSDIANLFKNCSKQTFGTITKSKMNSNKFPLRVTHPWFDRTCKRSRDIYHKTRKAYNKYKTPYFKQLLKSVSKQYKSTILHAQKKYKSDRIDKIRYLKHSDPRQYWNILNSKPKQSNITAPLNDFYNYFKTLNENSYAEEEDTTSGDNTQNTIFSSEDINREITTDEILKAVKGLKNNKSPGIDDIINEQIKNSITIMMKIYLKLFNAVFNSGVIPESWTLGIIKPIYKNKGDPQQPENYRPISLLSCLGKLFTCIINNRLKTYSENEDLINETQAGFRKNFSTADNIFILKSLIDLAQSKKKKLYCCFVDFKQAFDTVWRVGKFAG